MHGLLTSSAKSEMLSISLFAEMIRGNRIAINISPLCGDDLVHILQRTNLRTSDARNSGLEVANAFGVLGRVVGRLLITQVC